MTTEPCSSLPLRPARPAICSSWEVRSMTVSPSTFLLTVETTVVRAGMLTPKRKNLVNHNFYY
jgi:hypothetical protein